MGEREERGSVGEREEKEAERGREGEGEGEETGGCETPSKGKSREDLHDQKEATRKAWKTG